MRRAGTWRPCEWTMSASMRTVSPAGPAGSVAAAATSSRAAARTSPLNQGRWTNRRWPQPLSVEQRTSYGPSAHAVVAKGRMSPRVPVPRATTVPPGPTTSTSTRPRSMARSRWVWTLSTLGSEPTRLGAILLARRGHGAGLDGAQHDAPGSFVMFEPERDLVVALFQRHGHRVLVEGERHRFDAAMDRGAVGENLETAVGADQNGGVAVAFAMDGHAGQGKGAGGGCVGRGVRHRNLDHVGPAGLVDPAFGGGAVRLEQGGRISGGLVRRERPEELPGAHEADGAAGPGLAQQRGACGEGVGLGGRGRLLRSAARSDRARTLGLLKTMGERDGGYHG